MDGRFLLRRVMYVASSLSFFGSFGPFIISHKARKKRLRGLAL